MLSSEDKIHSLALKEFACLFKRIPTKGTCIGKKLTRSLELVDRLKAWAKANGKSQSDIARLIDVRPQRVSNWYRGLQVPSLENGIMIQRLIEENNEQ
jgi:DNA-binding XRE family transcriptional regulator